ncbi:ComEA family DNA-binding protein [Acidithiobacillus ferridurans]|uniref:ComEA family DNA-binding protein n=1 Tax=Acidithiobacillus ferridurans TaxID=1232575 RepID=UPI001D00B2C5|nr:helix-hairpin-helix domain-containing protein [Acidithiobacillus ferridurans]
MRRRKTARKGLWLGLASLCMMAAGAWAQAAGTGCPVAVDINHADAARLRCLPGIGEKRSAAIVAFREAHGPFPGPASLAAVLGPKMAQTLRARVVVTPVSR